jgi:hypothetical protein
MNRQFTLSSCVALAVWATCLSPAAARDSMTVAVFASHYVAAGVAFDDLNRLEGKVAAAHPSALRLESCGPGTTRALLGAMHRFRHLPLVVRTADAAKRPCALPAGVAVSARARGGLRPLGIDDQAVARYGENLGP